VAILFLAVYDRTQLVTDGVSLDNSTLARASVGVLTLGWPALAGLAARERRGLAALLSLVGAAAVIAVGSAPAVAALAVGVVTFTAAAARPKAAARLFAAATVALFIFGPLVVFALGALIAQTPHAPAFLQTVPPLAAFIKHEGLRLVTGHGYDAAARLSAQGPVPGAAADSLVFEVWYELGLLGAITLAFVVARAFLKAAEAPAAIAPFLLAALASALTLSVAALSTAQAWWVTLASVSGLLFVVAKRGRYQTRRPRLVSEEARRRQPAV
jgi:hypothetical protein